MRVCPVCRTANADTAKFCSECGAPLATAPAARREGRKVVTVVFADMVGSTERAERLDPEDVRALLAPYHERLRHELERHGGTVEVHRRRRRRRLRRRPRTRTTRSVRCAPPSRSRRRSRR